MTCKSGSLHLGLLLCAAFLAAGRARADAPGAGTHAEAEHLFQQGLEGMRAGDYGVACPLLSKSYEIDPLPGALFTLAECEAGWGKVATALAHYQTFVSALTTMSAERRDTFEERRRIAAGQISVLSVSAPEVTIDVAPNLAQDLVVKFEGSLVPASSYGVGRRVDPGSYAVTAELNGRRVWERSIHLEASSRAHVEVDPELPARSATPVALAGTVPASSDAREGSAARKTWLYVAGGVAIAGVATGLVTGALAYGKKSEIADNCPELSCTSKGRAALDSARGAARVSTVAFSVGAAGALAAIVLLSVSPDKARSTRPQSSRLSFDVSADAQSIGFSGAF